MASLFLTVIRELYLDTNRPLDISDMKFEEFELEDVDDEERKLQSNTVYVFFQALNYASSLVRYVAEFSKIDSSNEWFDLQDRLLQDRVQR